MDFVFISWNCFEGWVTRSFGKFLGALQKNAQLMILMRPLSERLDFCPHCPKSSAMNFVTSRLIAPSLCLSLVFAAATSGHAQEAKTPTPTPGESKYKSTINSAIPSSQSVRGSSPTPSRTPMPSPSASPKKKEIIRPDRSKRLNNGQVATPTPTATSTSRRP